MARRRRGSAGVAVLGLAWTVPSVMGLRLVKVARGGTPSQTEARLMVTEKLAAATQAQASWHAP